MKRRRLCRVSFCDWFRAINSLALCLARLQGGGVRPDTVILCLSAATSNSLLRCVFFHATKSSIFLQLPLSPLRSRIWNCSSTSMRRYQNTVAIQICARFWTKRRSFFSVLADCLIHIKPVAFLRQLQKIEHRSKTWDKSFIWHCFKRFCDWKFNGKIFGFKLVKVTWYLAIFSNAYFLGFVSFLFSWRSLLKVQW